VTIGQQPAVPGPDLSMTVTPHGAFTAGGTGGYQLTVSNATEAGPTTGPVTATFGVPAGQTMTSASGDGWTCQTANTTVTCTRADALQPGSAFPPIQVNTTIPAGASGQLTVTAHANTPGNADPNGADGRTTVAIAPPPVVAPSLSMTVTPQGPFTAGGSGSYQLTVSNAPGAGPTTGTVTATFPVPAGQTVTSASGQGWTCVTASQTVTCTRPGTGGDVLAGGGSYPPVTIITTVPADATGQVNVTATAGTPGNADPHGGVGTATATITPGQTLPPATGPALSLTVTPQGNFTAGGTGAYQLTVSNAASVGPTTGTVTATFGVPAGQTVTSATGPGWKCDTATMTVTCTRGDVLKPGSSYPPVTIATSIAASAGGPVNVTVGVNTPGDASPDGATGQATVIVAPAPSPGSVVCRGGNYQTTIGPGITFQTKTVQMTGQGDVGQCQSPSDPTVTGGTFTFQATGQGECPNGLNANGTGVIIWNNGQTSTVQGSAVIDQDQIGAVSMHVVAGEFAGDHGSFTGPITYLPWYECVFPTGVQSGRGIINVGFLNP
jgi:hypothetical protein